MVSIVIQMVASLYPGLLNVLGLTPALSVLSLVQVLTHMLSHANWPHLFGNFGFGLPFMIYSESRMGSKRFLLHYLLCGLGSCALFSLLTPGVGMIGSSGAIMGAAVGACLQFGKSKPTHLLGLGMALLLIVPQIAMAPFQELLGVAVYGHIGGALMAMLLAARLMPSKKV